MNVHRIRTILLCMCLVCLVPGVAIATQYLNQRPTHTVAAPFTVQEFLQNDNKPLYLRQPIEESLSKSDLPYLYDVLSNTGRYTQWHNALLALCVLEDGPRALETVVAKVTQPWDWGQHVYKEHQPLFPLGERIRYLWCISMIDPALSVPFLAPLVSTEGATAFLESWGALPAPTNDPHETENLVHSVQRAAAYALVHSHSPTAITPIANELQRQAGLTDSRGYWIDSSTVFMLTETLAVYDLLEEKGWEAGMGALREGHPGVGYGIAHPYFEKRFEEVLAITNTGPHMFWKRVVVRHSEVWFGLCALIGAGVLGTLVYRYIRRKAIPLPPKVDYPA